MKRVLFISGCFGDTQRYRVFNQMEQLELMGMEVVEKYFTDFEILNEIAGGTDVIIMHRVPHTLFIELVIKKANAKGIKVIFDVDDLIYNEKMAKKSDGIKYLPEEEKRLFFEGVQRYKKTIQLCDAAIVTTDFLAETIKTINDNVEINRNALSGELISISEQINNSYSKVNDEFVRIGYFSGTKTHNKDFLEVKDGLLRILEKHKHVKLCIGGLLDLSNDFERFKDRIERFPLVPWQELPGNIKKVDINLAPLEKNNPFCRAKSELKYYEAAILRVPTVASKIDAFEYAICDGDNGYLADSTEEWFLKLEKLVLDSEYRHNMGNKAYEDVLNRYTAFIRGEEYEKKIGQVLGRNNNYKIINNENLVINFIIPQPFKGSGGHTTIFRMVKHLVRSGHKVNIYVQQGENFIANSDKVVKKYIDENFFDTEANFFCDNGRYEKSDIFIATSWPTAYTVSSVQNTKDKFYFVQDFEPYFYPMSSEYKLAENTYKLGLKGITIGRWLTKELTNSYGMDCDFIDFAVDKNLYLLEEVKVSKGKTKIIFYARPSTPRRGVELALQGLEIVKKAYQDQVEICLFGGNLEELNINFEFRDYGVLSHEELAKLFKESDIGLVLSLTNCSLLPLELMASRCAVVDINSPTVEGIVVNEQNGLLANPDPIGISDQISRLIEDTQLRMELQERGFQFTRELDWSVSGDQFENIIIAKHLANEQGERIRNKKILANEEIDSPLPEIAYGVGYGQLIQVKENYLNRVDVFVGTYGRQNKGKLIFHLKKSPLSINDIVTISRDLSLIKDNSWVSFPFDAIENSEGQSYYFWIEVLSTMGNGITLYFNSTKEGMLINHKEQKGSLCFKAYVSTSKHFYYNIQRDLETFINYSEVASTTEMSSSDYNLNEIKSILEQKIKSNGLDHYKMQMFERRIQNLELSLELARQSIPFKLYNKLKTSKLILPFKKIFKR